MLARHMDKQEQLTVSLICVASRKLSMTNASTVNLLVQTMAISAMLRNDIYV